VVSVWCNISSSTAGHIWRRTLALITSGCKGLNPPLFYDKICIVVCKIASDVPVWWVISKLTYLPQSKHGFVLFTIWNGQLATKLVGPTFPQMDDKMAIELLRAFFIHKYLVNDHETTTQLLHQLSCLPLEAASYINKPKYQSPLTCHCFEIRKIWWSQDFEDGWRWTR
jgi:hypothetical protein